jgi:small conductance mechanosensitive channel
MDVSALTQTAVATLVAVAWKVVGALALWLIGRWLIAFALRLLGRALARQNVDATLGGTSRQACQSCSTSRSS